MPGKRRRDVRVHHVCMCYRRLLCYIIDADVVACVQQEFDDLLCPIRAVPQQTKVTQWFLRATKPALDLTQLVGELDKKLAVAVTLMLG